MTDTASLDRHTKKLTAGQTVGAFLLSCLFGFCMPFTLLFGVMAVLLATLTLAVLVRRRGAWAAILSGVLFSAASVLASGRVEALILSFSAWAGGFLLARAVARGDDRITTTVSITSAYLLVLLALGAYALFLSAEKAGQPDLLAHLIATLDGLANDITAAWQALYDEFVVPYVDAETVALLPTEGELHTVVVRLMAITPGILLTMLCALSLALTYLMQLTAAMLATGGGRAPLFREENRPYRVSWPFAILYLVVFLVSISWVDYTSAVSLVFQNVALVMTPAMAFGGILGLPTVFRLMRIANEGRTSYVIWAVMLVMLSLLYIQYAVYVFALVYAIYILYDAFRALRKKED